MAEVAESNRVNRKEVTCRRDDFATTRKRAIGAAPATALTEAMATQDMVGPLEWRGHSCTSRETRKSAKRVRKGRVRHDVAVGVNY